MRYTLQSCKYALKNFLYIVPFAVIPALFLSLSTDQQALGFILEHFFAGTLQEWNYVNLFRAASILNFASLRSIGFGLVGIIAMVACISMMMALMEKHMRFGKRTFNGIFSKLNDNLIPTGGYTLLVLVMYEVWGVITAALLFVVSRISIVWLAYVLISLVMILMHFGLLYGINLIYLWLPCMQITGFPAAEALQYSNQLSKPVKWRILISQTFFLFVVETLIFLCALFAVEWIAFTIISTALFTLLIIVYCVRMQIVYFDLDGIERKDLKKYYQR